MRRYVEASASHQNAARTERLLERIVPDPKLHARFVNTLARLEYVGVRKILKSRRAERLDLDGIQHILDEAVHTLRLKKAALDEDQNAYEIVEECVSNWLATRATRRRPKS